MNSEGHRVSRDSQHQARPKKQVLAERKPSRHQGTSEPSHSFSILRVTGTWVRRPPRSLFPAHWLDRLEVVGTPTWGFTRYDLRRDGCPTGTEMSDGLDANEF